MKQWSEITEPTAYSHIKLTAEGYTIFVDNEGTEEALTTFQSIQLGHAVFVDGRKNDQIVCYDNRSRALCLSGAGNLMNALKILKTGQSYPPQP